MISVANRQCKSVELHVAWQGCWELRVTYTGKPLSGRLIVDWRGWSIQGGEIDPSRSGQIGGAQVAMLVGGRSWSLSHSPRTLVDDRGIFASTVAKTLADSLGQTIVVANDRNLGRYWMRRRETGGQVLTRLFEQWHVGTDGSTRTGTRTNFVAKGVTVLNYDARERRAELHADRPDRCLPGAKIPETERHIALLVTDLFVTVDGEKERIVASVRAA